MLQHLLILAFFRYGTFVYKDKETLNKEDSCNTPM